MCFKNSNLTTQLLNHGHKCVIVMNVILIVGYNHGLTIAIKTTLAKFEMTRPPTPITLEGSYTTRHYRFGVSAQEVLLTPPTKRRTQKHGHQAQVSTPRRGSLRKQGGMEEAWKTEDPSTGIKRNVLTPHVGKRQFENSEEKDSGDRDMIPIAGVDSDVDNSETAVDDDVNTQSTVIKDDAAINGNDSGDDDTSDTAGKARLSQGDPSQTSDRANGNTGQSKQDINGNDTDVRHGTRSNLVTTHIDSFHDAFEVANDRERTYDRRRSNSATPLDLYNRFGRNRFKTQSHQSARPHSRGVTSHLHRCPAPDPYANAPQNGYSAVHGPHSSLESLVGEPDSPRNISRELVHMCTWYHVPGRYPTVQKPYVPKRLLRRLRLKKWQAAYDDYMLSDDSQSVNKYSAVTDTSNGHFTAVCHNAS